MGAVAHRHRDSTGHRVAAWLACGARQEYLFVFHLTLQEYFAAGCIAGTESPESLKRLVRLYGGDSRWREVWLLTTELLADATNLMCWMRERNDKIAEAGWFGQFLLAINQVANDGGVNSREANRLLALLYILRAGAQGQLDGERGLDPETTTVRREFLIALERASNIALLLGEHSKAQSVATPSTAQRSEHRWSPGAPRQDADGIPEWARRLAVMTGLTTAISELTRASAAGSRSLDGLPSRRRASPHVSVRSVHRRRIDETKNH